MIYNGTLAEVMEAGRELAEKGDTVGWNVVDTSIVPEVSRRVSERGIDTRAVSLIAGYLGSGCTNIQDYGATLAAAVLEERHYDPSMHWDIFHGLERVAYGDGGIFPRFRASVALAKAGQSIVADNGYRFDILNDNISRGEEDDADLAGIAKACRESLGELEKKLNPLARA